MKKKLTLFSMLCLAAFAVVPAVAETYRDGLIAAQRAIDKLITPAVIPWVELNTPNAANIATVLKGLEDWALYCDRAIVTTHPNYPFHSYPTLVEQSPLPIIGGIKTLAVSDNYADAEGWRLIAAISVSIAHVTGSNIVVLDSEAALKASPECDLSKLRVSLRELERTGLEYWFYLPHIKPGADYEFTTKLVETIHAALPTARFTLGKSGVPNGLDDPEQAALRIAMRRATGDQTIELLYFTQDGTIGRTEVFEVDELQEELSLRLQPAIVYPGWSNWLWSGAAWAEAQK